MEKNSLKLDVCECNVCVNRDTPIVCENWIAKKTFLLIKVIQEIHTETVKVNNVDKQRRTFQRSVKTDNKHCFLENIITSRAGDSFIPRIS